MDSFGPMLKVIAFTLQEVSSHNSLLQNNDIGLTRFHTLIPPKISILSYLQYIYQKNFCEDSDFIIAFILLDRLIKQQNQICITPNTVHKLFLCSLMTASKFTTDTSIRNSFWAQIGGLNVEELNLLELDFLFLLHFSLSVSPDEFHKYDDVLRNKSKLIPFTNL